MSTKIQLKLDFDTSLEQYLKKKYSDLSEFRILSKSLDARGAPNGKKPVYHYTVEIINKGESFAQLEQHFEDLSGVQKNIGAGPAGLFAALRAQEYGVKTTIVERGDIANKRMLYISKYWKKGVLNTENNVCFGEGGAGLFSDGKLITRVKSPFIKYVMRKFVEFGAPEEVEYLANPHLGSNKIRQLISKITDSLKESGHTFYYNNKAVDLIFENNKITHVVLNDGEKLKADHVILATGHSASDLYYQLVEKNVAMKHKDFAVGVRIEHPRELIDKLQHGDYYESEILGAAKYKLTYHDKSVDKGTYSFCMCPGGYVLSSGTDEKGIVVNGMSNYARNSRWSNSALVVTCQAGVDFSKDDILSGLNFQQSIEEKAFAVSKTEADGKMLPAMSVSEFLSGKLSDEPLPKTSCPSGLFKTDLTKIFPDFITKQLRAGLRDFDQKIPEFSGKNAVLIAPETRTSAPVTILRDKLTFESTSHKGLYPCGEGAGYAGGITSAAVDGIKIMESILK